jgi:hypothetical protein
MRWIEKGPNSVSTYIRIWGFYFGLYGKSLEDFAQRRDMS